MKIWRFCAGWNPERIPIAAAFYGVEDVDSLFGDLLAMDNAIKAHEEVQSKAETAQRARKGG